MAETTNIFIHNCVDASRIEKIRALPNVHVDVIELAVDEEVEHWHLPDERCADTHMLVDCFPPANLDDMRALRFLQISSVGFNQVIGRGLAERGVRVSNASGEFDVPIGEWNIAMMINLLRDVRGMIRNQESQTWDRAEQFQSEMAGHLVGIWGYGGIGRETARLCKSMNLTVHVMTREGVKPRTNVYCVPGHGDVAGVLPDRVFVAGQEHEFLRELDFLIVAMPLSPATRGIIGAAELNALPSHAFVLNPARGPLIEEEALVAALRDGSIAGAALDTHYYYPMPPEHPLWHFPNVIMTPHISGSNLSPHFKMRLWDIISENARRFTSDQPLLNELTARQLAGE
jgi:phosphoglycerate dehydrogenase-like enzyme